MFAGILFYDKSIWKPVNQTYLSCSGDFLRITRLSNKHGFVQTRKHLSSPIAILQLNFNFHVEETICKNLSQLWQFQMNNEILRGISRVFINFEVWLQVFGLLNTSLSSFLFQEGRKWLFNKLFTTLLKYIK